MTSWLIFPNTYHCTHPTYWKPLKTKTQWTKGSAQTPNGLIALISAVKARKKTTTKSLWALCSHHWAKGPAYQAFKGKICHFLHSKICCTFTSCRCLLIRLRQSTTSMMTLSKPTCSARWKRMAAFSGWSLTHPAEAGVPILSTCVVPCIAKFPS